MNKVLLDLGFIEIRWYSVIILCAILAGACVILKEAKKKGFSEDFINNLFFYTIICAIIGARLYYVTFNFSEYQNDLLGIFRIWEGGLAIHGGIIAGFITLVVYCKKYNANLIKITDMCCVPLILGQAIGRWGNFFNQEAHGAATTYAKLKDMHIPEFIINNMNIGGIYYTPTFLYESIWCFLGFIVLLIARKFKYLKVGQLTSIYLMWYSIGRFVIEASRTDSLMLGGFKVAQLVSVLLFLIGLFAFMILSRRSKFENLYSESNADQIRF